MKFSVLVSLMILSFTADARATTGGCVNANNIPSPTSVSSAPFVHCQASGYQGSSLCNEDGACTWSPVLYYQNYCNGADRVSVFESACPAGYSVGAYKPGAPLNPKFKCCVKIVVSTPTPTPTASPKPVGKCCNPGGNVVPSLVPCPTASVPHRCCNPAGNPVPPMVGASNQCKGR
jgi:hypothetical protein